MVFAGLTLAATLVSADAFNPLNLHGLCDASAAEGIGSRWVVVADDEDNALRVYDRHRGGMPVSIRDLSGFLGVSPKAPETDLEGAARVGDRIYWIASHGRNAKGKIRPTGGRLFATTWTESEGRIDLQPVGRPYTSLLADLLRDPQLASFGLQKAAQLAPKSPGGLNIEGLAATPDGHLLIGFRNPIPQRKALVVPLLNPAGVVAQQPARLGRPQLLDLGGQGIRSMTWFQDRFLIIAGGFAEGGKSRLFEWKGGDAAPRWIEGVDFRGLNPEAITSFSTPDGTSELFVTSDDGARKVGGKPCKSLKDPAAKSFRTLTFTMP
jgi:hypothetical protein